MPMQKNQQYKNRFNIQNDKQTTIELEKINEGKSSVSSVVTAQKSAHSHRLARTNDQKSPEE